MLVMPIKNFSKGDVNILNLKVKSIQLLLFIKILVRFNLQILM